MPVCFGEPNFVALETRDTTGISYNFWENPVNSDVKKTLDSSLHIHSDAKQELHYAV